MTNPWHYLRAAIAFTRVVRNPNRTDEVIQFMDHYLAAKRDDSQPTVQAFRDNPQGALALRDRPRLGPVSLDELAALPTGTLGREFADHMRRNRLDPAALPVLEAHSDKEYAIAHLHETHDIWHVVTAFGTDGPGELGIQAFYLAQYPSRIAIAILSMGFANTLFYALDEYGARVNSIVRGWVMGRRAQNLLGIDWKTLWSTPLAEIRARYDIDIDAADRLVLGLRGAAKVRARSL